MVTTDLQDLLQKIEEKLDWGPSSNWQSQDFELLNQLVFDKTNISLSTSTLRRIWGRAPYQHLPSKTTLDTLSRFAGFENWRSYLKSKQSSAEPAPKPVEIAGKRSISWVRLVSLVLIIVALGLLSLFSARKKTYDLPAAKYSFNSLALTRQIPNSVIFTYDATASPTDSVFIQQSWDPRTRTLVDKHLHKHSSVYYYPGFYEARLIVGDQTVLKHKLLIPTDGWLASINNQEMPVYLQTHEFMNKKEMSISASAILGKNIPLDPQPPMLSIANVGNFDPVEIRDFTFSASVKNNYAKGAGACQFSFITLTTDDAPIVIPLSVKGCVSELNARCVDETVSGKSADLSGFGVDFSKPVSVSCKSENEKIRVYVNGGLAYEFAQPSKKVSIVGINFFFKGPGEVSHISLSSGAKPVFHAFME